MKEIRLAKYNDHEFIYQIYHPFITNTHISFETQVPSTAEFSKRIKNTLVQFPWLICIIDDTIAGFSFASDHRKRDAYKWSVEVSVYIEEGFRKKGIAAALYTSLFEILELQNYKTMLAGISLPNDISIAFHESMGFNKIAEYHKIGYKFGSWYDVGWWQKSIGQFQKPPGQPISINQLIDTPEFNDAIKKGLIYLK